MGFWQNVENECEYLGISRKELAANAHFSVNTISNGIRRNGMPAADLALRISKALNVPLEKLLDIYRTEEQITTSTKQKNKKLLIKYSQIIQKLDSLNDKSKKAVMTLIEELST